MQGESFQAGTSRVQQEIKWYTDFLTSLSLTYHLKSIQKEIDCVITYGVPGYCCAAVVRLVQFEGLGTFSSPVSALIATIKTDTTILASQDDGCEEDIEDEQKKCANQKYGVSGDVRDWISDGKE